MEDGFIAAPEAGVSVETWKQQHVHRCIHVKTDKCISCDTYNNIVMTTCYVRQAPVAVNCSP